MIVLKHSWCVDNIWNVRMSESAEAVGWWSSSKRNVRGSEIHTPPPLLSFAFAYGFGNPTLTFSILLFSWDEVFSVKKQLNLIDSKAVFLGRTKESSGDTWKNLSDTTISIQSSGCAVAGASASYRRLNAPLLMCFTLDECVWPWFIWGG